MKPTVLHRQHGFTFIEILIVIGILAALFSIGVIGIMNIRVTTTNSTSATVFISDIKTQQIKAMTGDTEGRGTPDNYGVKILTDRYILFNGMTFSASNPSNITIPTATGYTISTTFPSTTILFASASGEIVGFSDSTNTVTIRNTQSGKSQVIHFNRYGAATQINQ